MEEEPFVYDLPLVGWYVFSYHKHTVWSMHQHMSDVPFVHKMMLFEGFQNNCTQIWRGSEYLEYAVVCIAITIHTNEVFVILADRSNYKSVITVSIDKCRGKYPSAVFLSRKVAQWFLTYALEEYCKYTQSKEEWVENITVDDLEKLYQKYGGQTNISKWDGPFVLSFTILRGCKKARVEIAIPSGAGLDVIQKEWIRAKSLHILEQMYFKKQKEAFWFLLCAKRLGLYKDVANLIVKYILK